MSGYKGFARFYSTDRYTNYSLNMAEKIPVILREEFGIIPQKLLDIACGEGSFAIKLSEAGVMTTGIDLSKELIEIAKENAFAKGSSSEFSVEDMCSLKYEEEFDVVTCIFDSLNHLLSIDDLKKAFDGAYRALKPKGVFVFDMNTIYALSVNWMKMPYLFSRDNEDLFEAMSVTYDYENNIATMDITGFYRKGENWGRIDEAIQEKGYRLEDIRNCFSKSGFTELTCWGSLKDKTSPKPESGRVWFFLRKK